MKEMIYMADIKYEIKETVGSLSENNKGWSKELNLISWNDREPKYDIRDSYAMENASTNCKQQAKNIAPSNQLSGVIEVLEALEF